MKPLRVDVNLTNEAVVWQRTETNKKNPLLVATSNRKIYLITLWLF